MKAFTKWKCQNQEYENELENEWKERETKKITLKREKKSRCNRSSREKPN